MTASLHTGARTATIGRAWSAWDTSGLLVITDPWALHEARDVLEEELGAVDRIAARGCRAGARLPGPAIGPLPYGLTSAPPGEPVHRPAPQPWETDPVGGRGVLRLESGPSLRATAAQRCAEVVAEATSCGTLVAIGADVATSGLAPRGGWRVELPAVGEVAPLVLAVDGGAVSWIDTARHGRPGLRRVTVRATGRTADPVWRHVAVVAANGPAASAACAGALLRGSAAPAWLGALGLAARLVAADGTQVAVGSWPA
jgi:hypothetical protein